MRGPFFCTFSPQRRGGARVHSSRLFTVQNGSKGSRLNAPRAFELLLNVRRTLNARKAFELLLNARRAFERPQGLERRRHLNLERPQSEGADRQRRVIGFDCRPPTGESLPRSLALALPLTAVISER